MWREAFAPLSSEDVFHQQVSGTDGAVESPRKILVFRIGELGDTIITLPAFWAIRRHFPAAHLCLLSNSHGAGRGMAGAVLPATGLFDSYLHYPSSITGSGWRAGLGLHREIRSQRFDLAIQLTPSLRSPRQVRRDTLFFASAGIRRQIINPAEGAAQTGSPAYSEHETDHLLSRLERNGIPVPAQPAMDLQLTAAELRRAGDWFRAERIPEDRPVVALGPGAAKASKIWPEERFVQLGRRMLHTWNVHLMVFGGPRERELGNRLICQWGRGTNAAGALPVRESAAALAHCAFYVGNDTGTTHLAAASGIGCVAITSAQDLPGKWSPYGSGHTVLRRHVPCGGCRLAECREEKLRCLTEITVDEAYAACAGMLMPRIRRRGHLHGAVPLLQVLTATGAPVRSECTLIHQ